MKNRRLLLLPTLNEENAIKKLIPEIPRGYDVIVVDSGSTDETLKIAKNAGYGCMRARYGRGHGSATRTAFEYFLENGYHYLLVIDCDYSDDPNDIKKVLKMLESGGYDVIMGVRDFKKQLRYVGIRTIFVKKMVRFCIKALTGLEIRDALTGVWGFNKKAVTKIEPHMSETGFEDCFGLTYHAWNLGLRIGEEDVNFRPRVGKTKFSNRLRLLQVLYGIKYGLLIVLVRVGRLIPA